MAVVREWPAETVSLHDLEWLIGSWVAKRDAAGWLLGGSGNASAMVMATSVRNVGVALVIVTGIFAGTPAVASATVFALFQTVLMALIAAVWGRLASSSAAPPATTSPRESKVHQT
jgi:hypothetical protein